MIDSLAATPQAGPSIQQNVAAGRAGALASDFEVFLQMLTAQAKYQDPMEPIDSSQYAAQLAQFSMVEQQVQTNQTLTALFGQMGASNMASLAGWVGMDARAVTPLPFDGTPIAVSPNPAAAADKAFLVVSNQAGDEVQRVSIPVSSESMEWAGVADDGSPIANGLYSFSVESFSKGELIRSDPAGVYGRITEAQVRNGKVILILQGGQAIPASSVTALRGGS
jgi:flagellar basal-body rod modification protein FlgD